MDPNVLFFCLIIIEFNLNKRWHELEQATAITLNKLLLSFIEQVCGKEHLLRSIPVNVREKTAQILVQLMKRQYLLSWQSFFKDLCEILKHGESGSWDMFWRILQDLNWCIHENGNQCQEALSLNNAIKDKMRENDLQQIVEIWYAFLTNYQKYSIELTQQCLHTMDKYISWIDISFVSSPRFMSILYQYLEIVPLQNESVDCLYELVTKRMDDSHKKFQLLQKLNIIAVLNKLDIANHVNGGTNQDKLEFAESIADLIDATGVQLIGCCKDNVPNAQSAMFECYQLALKYFSHPSFKVNQQCCEFLSQFWCLIKRQNERKMKQTVTNGGQQEASMSDTEQNIYTQTVQLISKNLCYPDEYDVNEPDDPEAEFDEYRKFKLDKLIAAMTRAYPDYMLNGIGLHFSKTCQMISSSNEHDRKQNDLSWQHIESDLHLIYKICEDYGPRNIDELIQKNEKFGNLFEYSLKADICSKHPHPMILLTYFHLVHRYNAFFHGHPEYIAQILKLFVMCIQQTNHAKQGKVNGTLRAQASYFLQKLIAKLYLLNSNKVNQVLMQYMDMLIQSLGTCLQTYIHQKRSVSMFAMDSNHNENAHHNLNPRSLNTEFDADDIKNVCGVLGQLILLNKGNNDKLSQHCNQICGIFMNELNNYIVNHDKWIQINAPLISQIMSQYIVCVQSFFKPFEKGKDRKTRSNSNSQNEYGDAVKNILIQFTQIVIKSYSCIPNSDELRKDSITFVHKVVYILGEHILKELNPALQIYIQYLNANNCVLTLQVITNIVIQLRRSVIPILDTTFYPLFEAISNILASFDNNRINTIGNSGYEQEKISKLDIERHFYTLLLKIFQCGCCQIFLSNQNAPHFDKVISCILNGCIIRSDSDVSVYKACFSILKEMLIAIKSNHPSMKELYCNKVLKLSFDFGLHPNYKEANPDYDRTLKIHIFGIHHHMFKIFGVDVITNCIGTYLVTQCNVDTNTARKYCELCVQGNQTRKLRDMVLSIRSMAQFNELNTGNLQTQNNLNGTHTNNYQYNNL
eukprot:CAMPEP_0197081006 /NCGR_PEP_ID=MMETSP1384-20130603/214414_1 /TAXON_ID=29189 /ORGANISM="Ammonia sp." /LENGTH=1028 /DNA_ID=CAMNT_0042519897 /DNA_START=153 /DNA_END=3239 /DNA_ORIENTATION=+